MTKCIYCGKEARLSEIMTYICDNVECSNPDKEWTLSENKNNMDWAIRHIRALETKIKTLEQVMHDAGMNI